MFSSYDMKNLGNAFRVIRHKSKFTQKKVSELTGINIDTLRKIENGKVVPRYETIELLSSCYKIDLTDIFKKHRQDKELFDLYNLIDSLIISNDLSEINTIKSQLNDQELSNNKITNSISCIF